MSTPSRPGIRSQPTAERVAAAPPSLTSGSPAILQRLRSETRHAHDTIERALDLLNPALTLATYRRRIEQLHGYYQPVEHRLSHVGDWREIGLNLEERRKLPLIETDLAALGSVRPSDLPTCDRLPRLGSVASAFGCLYVLEGASLGGQVISRHVQAALGVTTERGGRFFHGYGPRTGAMWQEFSRAITGLASTRQIADTVLAAAVETFETLRQWLEKTGER